MSTDGQQPSVTAHAPGASGGITEKGSSSALDLATIYDDHASFVWRVAKRLGVPDGALEDVMHDVFVIVHRRIDDYDGRAAITSWLYGITRGVASNRRRGRAREARRIEHAQPKPQTLPPTDDAAQRREAAAFVRRFLDRLDADKREVFTLVDLEGNSVKAVANMTGINVNTAHARLRAARLAFRQAAAAFTRDPAESESA
ncbi:MAG: RNA polymerase sigma factor [Nannocystales bacterium]